MLVAMGVDDSDKTSARRGSPDPAVGPTEGLPRRAPGLGSGDLRSPSAAGSGDPRRAGRLQGFDSCRITLTFTLSQGERGPESCSLSPWERAGVRVTQRPTASGLRRSSHHPHPNPLPEGEGTRRIAPALWVNSLGYSHWK